MRPAPSTQNTEATRTEQGAADNAAVLARSVNASEDARTLPYGSIPTACLAGDAALKETRRPGMDSTAK